MNEIPEKPTGTSADQRSWSEGYRAGWEAGRMSRPEGWHGNWHRGWFPLPFFPLVIVLVVIALATGTWWVLLGIPALWLLSFPRRRRRWAGSRRGWAC